MKTSIKLFGGLFFLLACATPARGGVVINEIMYHPASTNALEEWIELYNNGATNVNLSGWKITKVTADDKTVTLKGTIPNAVIEKAIKR